MSIKRANFGISRQGDGKLIIHMKADGDTMFSYTTVDELEWMAENFRRIEESKVVEPKKGSYKDVLMDG